jgi:hypothetical protein
MSHSSPEGIILGKGSTLVSAKLIVDKEVVLDLKSKEKSYSEEELIILLKKFKKDIINSIELDDDFETLICDIKTNKWFEKHKKK